MDVSATPYLGNAWKEDQSDTDETYSLEWLFELELPVLSGVTVEGEHSDCCSFAVKPHNSHNQCRDSKELKAETSSQSFTPNKTSTVTSSTEHSFYPITMELRPDTVQEFLLAAEENSKKSFKSDQPFCLVGLHTCGDLCSTALRLFAEVPQAQAVCVVGCCYHHITEQDDLHSEESYISQSYQDSVNHCTMIS